MIFPADTPQKADNIHRAIFFACSCIRSKIVANLFSWHVHKQPGVPRGNEVDRRYQNRSQPSFHIYGEIFWMNNKCLATSLPPSGFLSQNFEKFDVMLGILDVLKVWLFRTFTNLLLYTGTCAFSTHDRDLLIKSYINGFFLGFIVINLCVYTFKH